MSGHAKEVYSKYIKELAPDERAELLVLIETDLSSESAAIKKHSLAELRGLGKSVWGDLDIERYIDGLRDEWEGEGS